MNYCRSVSLALAVVVVSGCATSTIETRKQERYSAYSELPQDVRAVVDEGKIKVGMPADAVYIAWGKPSQIVQGESAQGNLVTWLYHGSYLEEVRYWTFRDDCIRGRFVSTPYLEHDYYPRGYLRAEVVFENGRVREWRTLPAPLY